MQFYTALWLDTGLTLSDIGLWEEKNPHECEAYITGYIKKQQMIMDARKKATRK